jgi:hypothetical protein
MSMNSLDIKVVEDGRRNAIVRIIGVADTANITQTPAISLSQFTNNDPGVTFNGLRLVEADFAVTNQLSVLLEWNGNTKQAMAALTASGEFRLRRHGGYGPDRTASGYDGNINLRTIGYVPGNAYTFEVMLRMTKMYA